MPIKGIFGISHAFGISDNVSSDGGSRQILVTYNVDTGELYEEKAKKGTDVTIPATFVPSKAGYDFLGWREDSTASSSVLPEKIADKDDITLYAVFRKTIPLYMYNGSTSQTSQTGYRYYNNTNIIYPSFNLSEAAVSGWNKAGWTTSASGYTATVSDGASVQITADSAEYYSLYTVGVTVTKYNNYQSPANQTETKNRIANYHSSVTYSNPSFTLTLIDSPYSWIKLGWNQGADSHTVTVSDGGSVTLTSNQTYYALYYKVATVNWYNNSSTATTETKNVYVRSSASGWVYENAVFSKAVATVSGWSIRGWSTSSSANAGISYNSGANVSINDGITTTLYASWSKTVTVTYYNNSSSASSTSGTAYRGYKGDITNASFNLTVATVSGWSIRGWSTSNGSSATITYNSGAAFSRSDNVTLYASWSKTVTVTYYNNSATAGSTSGTAYRSYNGTATNPTFKLTVATVSGWTIRGWSTSSSASAAISYNSNTNFTRDSNVTLYASWSASVTVTYYNNSSTASSTSGTRYRGYKGDITNPTFNLTVSAVSGWTARGWSTSSSASGAISYNSATNFTRDSNVTLYSSWSKTVTVSYNGNSATSGSTSASTGTAYRSYNGTVTNASISLRANGFVRTNYTFFRWASGSASGTQYKAGASLSLNANVTMYANWIVTKTNFAYTGGMQSFTALAGVTYLLEVWGGQGGSSVWTAGGLGGYSKGNKSFSSNTTIYICVGGKGADCPNTQTQNMVAGGYNGGGVSKDFNWNWYPNCAGGGGGGATHIGLSNAVLASTSSSNVIIVAGGGGGGTLMGSAGQMTSSGGGAGGGTSGGDGPLSQVGSSGAAGGKGGTQTAGGASGYHVAGGTEYYAGSYGKGGGTNYGYLYDVLGGGGGGGYYGGGSGFGRSVSTENRGAGGGGGGSGYTGGVTGGSMSNGQRSGSGYCTITVSSVA